MNHLLALAFWLFVALVITLGAWAIALSLRGKD